MIIALVAPSTIFSDGFMCSEDPALNNFCLPRLKKFRTYCPNDSLLQLIALTPPENEIVYMDDQFKNVDYSCRMDVAAITVLTMYAERAYGHAAEWRRRGVHVVMGGVHVTMEPDEALQHADTIVTGVTGFFLGGVLSLTNIYVGIKTGWVRRVMLPGQEAICAGVIAGGALMGIVAMIVELNY